MQLILKFINHLFVSVGMKKVAFSSFWIIGKIKFIKFWLHTFIDNLGFSIIAERISVGKEEGGILMILFFDDIIMEIYVQFREF